uniref:AlNc14C106G6241 protein n=1 Tax=Albugo laibachii Nc14 TaxID=890382 RepID=F0WI34_9STRA|nr:AlNc14C106G6241 [Albugo laibachii Nc14]|eukprot:CCA20912.1 AlNc14C106G6241 [Albugo laibachii Nc14]
MTKLMVSIPAQLLLFVGALHLQGIWISAAASDTVQSASNQLSSNADNPSADTVASQRFFVRSASSTKYDTEGEASKGLPEDIIDIHSDSAKFYPALEEFTEKLNGWAFDFRVGFD